MSEIYYAPIKIFLESENLLIDKFSIRKITDEERKRFLKVTNVVFNENGNAIGWSIMDHKDSTFVHEVEHRFMECQYIVKFSHNNFDKFDKLILALRLFKEGGIIAPVAFNDLTNSMHFFYPQITKDRG